ncbi:MAG: PilZ domain-containing protein [Gammaproteobacteria bacterium]|jgi:hypothetical protein|nr:PilZ domain-containing protein [Gammaproteobacteria bacterium]
MSIDKRFNARGMVRCGKEARFSVKSEDGVYTITRLCDVSLSGAGVETRYPLRQGERIRLKYRSDELTVAVNGTVAWCTATPGDIFNIGVSFCPEERQRNAVFFLALRRYLSELGGDAMQEKSEK